MSENYTPTPANKYQRKSNSDHKYRHQNMSVDMDVWYPMLKSITFKTYFIPLKYCEAEAITAYHDFRSLRRPDFKKEYTKILILLQQKIDYYFNTIDDIKNGAMFRLSGRSGKDVDYYDNEEYIFMLFKEFRKKLSKI